MSETPLILIGALGIFFFMFLQIALWARCMRTAGPNEVLVISGRPRSIVDPQGNKHEVGFRLVKGGTAFVIPIIEKASVLSLESMLVEIPVAKALTRDRVPVSFDASAQVKIKGEEFAIITAAENYLGKDVGEIVEMARHVLEGHIWEILGTVECKELFNNREEFSVHVQEIAAPDMAKTGLVIISLTCKNLRELPSEG